MAISDKKQSLLDDVLAESRLWLNGYDHGYLFVARTSAGVIAVIGIDLLVSSLTDVLGWIIFDLYRGCHAWISKNQTWL